MNQPEAKRAAYRRLARRHGPACVYCRAPLTEPDAEGRAGPTCRTLDHYIPRAKGGADRLGNLEPPYRRKPHPVSPAPLTTR